MFEPRKVVKGKDETPFLQGGGVTRTQFFSLDHAEEVYREAKELNDPVWDCTLIKTMRDREDSIVNPIYEWMDSDIWDYINKEHIKVNPLYAKGYSRVGCIGCPLAGYYQMKKEFNDYPKYKQMYIQAFDKMIEARKAKNKTNSWKTGEEVFNWWIGEYKHNVKGQLSLFDN